LSESKDVFEIVVIVAVQSAFRIEMDQNKFFLLNFFYISTLNKFETIKKIHFKQKKQKRRDLIRHVDRIEHKRDEIL